jgi:hypothetical protein
MIGICETEDDESSASMFLLTLVTRCLLGSLPVGSTVPYMREYMSLEH